MMTWLENLVVRLSNRVSKQIDDLTDRKAFEAAQDAQIAGNFKTALDEYEKLALRGHGRAAALAAGMHIQGEGTKVSGANALIYLEMGKDAGDPDAIGLLGIAYASGMPGIKVDYTKARPLLETAAKNGYGRAQEMLDHIKDKQGKQGKRI